MVCRGPQLGPAVTPQQPEASTLDSVGSVAGVQAHGGIREDGDGAAKGGRIQGIIRLRSTVLENVDLC